MVGPPAPLRGFHKQNLREQALSALWTAITSGELESGRHRVETELSELLQVSRGQLREALRTLSRRACSRPSPQTALRLPIGHKGSPGHLRRPHRSGSTRRTRTLRTARPAARHHILALGY